MTPPSTPPVTDKTNATATLAARLSALAYHNEEIIRAEMPSIGANSDDVHFLYGANIFGFIVKFPEFAFIVFRGSQTLGDWINNFDIRVIRTFCGHIHYGFAKSLDSIPRDSIEKIIATFKKPSKLYITGHSRGGALAFLTGAILIKSGYRPTAIYTFGAPKFGLASFRDWWKVNGSDVQTFCFTNKDDPVPHLPPGPEDIPHVAKLLLKIIVYVPRYAIRLMLRNLKNISNKIR